MCQLQIGEQTVEPPLGAIQREHSQVSLHSIRKIELTCIQARRKNPQHVKRMAHDDFFDFKKLGLRYITNRDKTSDGTRVKWMAIKAISFRKDSPRTETHNYTSTAMARLESSPLLWLDGCHKKRAICNFNCER